MSLSKPFSEFLFKYKRRTSLEVLVGNVGIGGKKPIIIQSMTTEDTMNIDKVVSQCVRMIEAGCEIVRLATPSQKEAHQLGKIKRELAQQGYNTPLVADIHFTPNAAEIAAQIVEKVRINPGNYADKKKNQFIDYTDSTYHNEIKRIKKKFLPLVHICKKYKTIMRIGTNHGSLSDRIMSKYGDTSLGMVESALEFARICHQENYHDVVISMKSSNPRVMVHAYRLLVQKLKEENLPPYPLHLGVTEAGEGEDGRIKSSMGIGTLLADGLGDTIRVSLTEEPENEIPIAKKLAERFNQMKTHQAIKPTSTSTYSPFEYKRRETVKIHEFGSEQVPLVFADLSNSSSSIEKTLKALGHYTIPLTGKNIRTEQSADVIYWGKEIPPDNFTENFLSIADYVVWKHITKKNNKVYPLINIEEFIDNMDECLPRLACADYLFLMLKVQNFDQLLSLVGKINNWPVVLILTTDNDHKMMSFRSFFLQLQAAELPFPVVLKITYSEEQTLEDIALEAAVDIGGVLLDGWGNGVWLSKNKMNQLDNKMYSQTLEGINQLAFNILQAGRQRITKTEYISCPSCGRTLFDLQETTTKIRARTEHLKGLKIGIMGCIVNGPGEMADADYGYVGSGKNKITLYRGQKIVKKGVNTVNAVDELINLIKEDGNWEEEDALNN